MCAGLLFNNLFQAYCTKSEDGVVVKAETLHPLESIAVNNVLSCFGNDKCGGGEKHILSLLFLDPFKMQNEPVNA